MTEPAILLRPTSHPMINKSHPIHYKRLIVLLVQVIGLLSIQCCVARDTIRVDSSISDNEEMLESAGRRFQLGFFSPNEEDRIQRYVGIWYYNSTPRTVVWVANQDDPVSDRSGVFALDAEDGKLKVRDGNRTSHFSTDLEIPFSSSSNRTAQLLDSGNLVLFDNQSGKQNILWESFHYPRDTFLPGMKMDETLKLTSWRNTGKDPRSGNFTFEQNQEDPSIYLIRKNGAIYWRSGEPGKLLISSSEKFEMPNVVALLLTNFSNIDNLSNYQNSSNNKTYGEFPVPTNTYNVSDYIDTRLLMNSSGQIQFYRWEKDKGWWSLIWSEPDDHCSVYNACGKFGICNSQNQNRLECKCLAGFNPNSLELGDYSNGCTRKSTICNKTGKTDEFLNLNMKLAKPDDVRSNEGCRESCLEGCRESCLEDCSCQAYAYNEGDDGTRRGRANSRRRCMIWTSDLVDLKEGYADGGYNLSVRVPISDIDVSEAGTLNNQSEPSRHKKTLPVNVVIISTSSIFLVLLLCIFGYIVYRRKAVAEREELRGARPGNPLLHMYEGERRDKDLMGPTQFVDDDKGVVDVPFFKMKSILEATDNFSNENKLGQGGFGPVYRGMFPGGQEIAVKRLSINSGQGLEEFKNEVILIAKLQHRNLVRLLGYCINADEKILLYEYMPNRSLDAFIFDRTLGMLLDWEKRFDIILGIARGLLYLHQDSRLRIIHRDLKTSNILLDEEMNPKISDFGLARIVGGKETEANTNRVVGTYGYISPEYALDGLFSIKSDVFSFGVVILEIISGKRNTEFYQSEEALLNLLGHTWRLWKEDRAMELMDQTLRESCNRSEVFRCIIVGLVCVQEDPSDRPTMSNVVLMLGSETATLPIPKQPAFVARKRLSGTPSSSSSKPEAKSKNELTVSIEEGR